MNNKDLLERAEMAIVRARDLGDMLQRLSRRSRDLRELRTLIGDLEPIAALLQQLYPAASGQQQRDIAFALGLLRGMRRENVFGHEHR